MELWLGLILIVGIPALAVILIIIWFLRASKKEEEKKFRLKELEIKAKYHKEKPIVKETQFVTCKYCGYANPDSLVKCQHCGAKL